MSLRLHEVHPSLVHFPLTLVPLSLALDAVGWLTGRRAFCNTARSLMPVAAASTLVTGAAGLVAQEAVRADGKAHDLLTTHRNLNLCLAGAVVALAALRTGKDAPSAGYLLAGLAGVLGMQYTAYLGGKMVYGHGVGVQPHGVRDDRSPALRPGNVKAVARATARAATEGIAHIARETREGRLAPALGRPAD